MLRLSLEYRLYQVNFHWHRRVEGHESSGLETEPSSKRQMSLGSSSCPLFPAANKIKSSGFSQINSSTYLNIGIVGAQIYRRPMNLYAPEARLRRKNNLSNCGEQLEVIQRGITFPVQAPSQVLPHNFPCDNDPFPTTRTSYVGSHGHLGHPSFEKTVINLPLNKMPHLF